MKRLIILTTVAVLTIGSTGCCRHFRGWLHRDCCTTCETETCNTCNSYGAASGMAGDISYGSVPSLTGDEANNIPGPVMQ
ncbi:MAG: hypothetical protein ACI9G1_001651 [Pirellulaceae bacterium]|jgi:hypothetical protein